MKKDKNRPHRHPDPAFPLLISSDVNTRFLQCLN
jgi:hypothetical protein